MWFRYKCFELAQHEWFDIFIMGCILANTLSMAVEHYGQSDTMTEVLYVFEWIFVIIFALEAFIKISAYGWRLYWASSWNKFDFVIVIVGIISVINVFGDGIGL